MTQFNKAQYASRSLDELHDTHAIFTLVGHITNKAG